MLCLSHLVLLLLAALPSSAGAVSVHAHTLSFAAVNHFSFDETPNEEETTKSRSAQLPLNVVQLAEVETQNYMYSNGHMVVCFISSSGLSHFWNAILYC